MTIGTLPTGGEKTVRVRAMFDAIAPRYDLVNRLITFGLDERWRRRTADALGLAPGSTVLDLACGTGALGAAARRAGYRVVGADMSTGMLTRRRLHGPAATRRAPRGVPGERSGGDAVQCDAAALPLASASVDGVICGYALRNFTDLTAAIHEAGRVVRPGGRIAVLEVATPPNPLVRAGHRVWFRHVVPRIGAAVSDRDAYQYLPDSVAYLPDGRALQALLRDAGFATVGRRLLQGGVSQLLTGTRAADLGAPGRARGSDGGGATG